MVEIWNCDVATGMLRMLARDSNRKREPLEEACLIQELIGLGKSKEEISKSLGRSVSWLSRRLKLADEINQEWWLGLRKGWLKPWALERVVMPLARANKEHAEQLTTALKKESLSTRELKTWFTHYEKAPKARREKMVEDPHLFLAALASVKKDEQAKLLAAGLEGKCLKDVQILLAVSRRLEKNLPELGSVAESGELETLRNEIQKTCNLLENLVQQLPRSENEPETGSDHINKSPRETECLGSKNRRDALTLSSATHPLLRKLTHTDECSKS